MDMPPQAAAVTRSPAAVGYEPPGAVARLGMIALATDLTTERDAMRYLPHRSVAMHVTRVPFENPSTPDNLAKIAPNLAAAADLILPGIALAAIGFACTAASVEIGDAAIAEAIAGTRPGVPVVTPPDAAVAGFAALRARRIALVTPYLEETTAPMAAYFTGRGLDVVRAACLGIADDRDIARVSAATIVAAAEAADGLDVEAVFLSCTALPAIGVLDAIEARLGKPVISSNQALIWRLLHHAGVAAPADAPGRLFKAVPPDQPA